jgi:hypothetical protein
MLNTNNLTELSAMILESRMLNFDWQEDYNAFRDYYVEEVGEETAHRLAAAEATDCCPNLALMQSLHVLEDVFDGVLKNAGLPPVPKDMWTEEYPTTITGSAYARLKAIGWTI